MSSGLELDENGPILDEILSGDNWLKSTFAQPMRSNPGEKFTYCTLLTHAMSGILTKASGRGLLELGREYLFEPLGISRIYWEQDPQGLYFGGDRLWITPRDMAKFGYLFLNDGKWQNRQLVPEEWVEESTKNQLAYFNKDGYSGYGYWWWLADNGVFRARGFGGQIISVYPELNMVVVFTGADNNLWEQLIEEYIVPAVTARGSLPRNDAAAKRIGAAIHELELPASASLELLPEIAGTISGRKYILKKMTWIF